MKKKNEVPAGSALLELVAKRFEGGDVTYSDDSGDDIPARLRLLGNFVDTFSRDDLMKLAVIVEQFSGSNPPTLTRHELHVIARWAATIQYNIALLIGV